MKNTQPYIERIKIASLAKGVVLDDKQALEVLTRTVGLVPVVMEPKPNSLTWKKKVNQSLKDNISMMQ
jgi:hypothetical protein